MRFLPSRFADRDEFGRLYWHVEALGERGDSCSPDSRRERRQRADDRMANVVGSELEGGAHAPALDIDLPCRLVPSSTDGHYHLYIDKPMSWRSYVALMRALQDAGILEPGYVDSAINRGQSFLRLPHVRKPTVSESSYLGESEYAL